MNKSILFIALSCLALQCETQRTSLEPESELTACKVKDPINDLKWLNDEFKSFIGGPATNGIILFRFEDKEVIEVQSSVFNSTNQHQYYCDGKKLNLDDPARFQRYRKERQEVKVLYGVDIWR